MDIKDIISKYGVPDQSIVGKLPRGGATLDFVGHAEITRILIDIDPLWNWEPVAWSPDGRPQINVVNGNAVMWGTLTVLGHSRLGVGTARHDKADLDKELIGDFLRNAAMRFGICLSLWSKTEWEDQPEAAKPAPKVDTESAIKRFRDACTKEGLDAEKFANDSGVPFLQDATPEQIETLRTAFREHKSKAAKPEAAKPEAAKPEVAKPATGNKARMTSAEITHLAMSKGFKKEERMQMAKDIAGRDILKLDDLTSHEANLLIDILEAARAEA